MVDVVITYETLFDVLRKEKSRDELQQLPEDFYGQLVAYLQQKRADVEAAGGFNAPGSQKLLIQYRNVQKILRELYERRERKILEMSINRARTESNLIDRSTLLNEEQEFFEKSSELLKQYKKKLLEPTLLGELPEGVSLPEKQVEPENTEVEKTPPELHEGPEPSEIAIKEACKVRFLAAVPKFLGLKGEIHGPFQPGDDALLPGKIAAVLLKKKRVEIVESA